jgi:hypothetical protein
VNNGEIDYSQISPEPFSTIISNPSLLESLSLSFWATFSVNLAYILFLGFNDIKRLVGISKVCGGSQPQPKRLTWIQVTLLTPTFYYDAARSQVFVSG